MAARWQGAHWRPEQVAGTVCMAHAHGAAGGGQVQWRAQLWQLAKRGRGLLLGAYLLAHPSLTIDQQAQQQLWAREAVTAA